MARDELPAIVPVDEHVPYSFVLCHHRDVLLRVGLHSGPGAGEAIRSLICGVVAVTLLPSPSFGSSAVAIVTAQGIVVGVDEKSVVRCDGPCGPWGESRKIVLVQGRVALSTAGLHAVLGNAHQIAPYAFPSFAGRVGARLPPGATVSDVSDTVREEAGKVFSWFDMYLRRSLFGPKDFPDEYPVEYLIAGYEAQIPTIYAVRVEVDWQRQRLKGVQRTLVHPTTDAKAHRGIYGAGSKRVVDQITHQQGELYRRAASEPSFKGQTPRDANELSLEQASILVRRVLEIEADANPGQVGPPFTVATIPRDGVPHLDAKRSH